MHSEWLVGRVAVVRLVVPVMMLSLMLSGVVCTGPGGGGGGGGGNDNQPANDNTVDNVNSNGNDNLDTNGNDNVTPNENDNAAANDNVNSNANDNTAANENDNTADNENANDNVAPPPVGLPGDSQRAAFQSQCAQNVITCTTTFPVAIIGLGFLPGQTLTTTPAGFRITGSDGNGSERVQMVGSGSTAGDGATALFFSWAAGATDGNPCTLAPGSEFSTEPSPQVDLQAGFHYIRLTVRNDLPPIDEVNTDFCGTFLNYFRLDFEEIEVEVVD